MNSEKDDMCGESGESGLIVTTSWDDGHPSDLRLAELLASHGLAATFYVTPRNHERAVLSESGIRELAESFEIAAHSLTHATLTLLESRKLEEEVSGSKKRLEDIAGASVSMFAYPKGIHNARVRRCVARSGFRGARTVAEFYTSPGRDRWRLPTTVEAAAHGVLRRVLRGLRRGDPPDPSGAIQLRPGIRWSEIGRTSFERARETGGIWHLWGHSWVLDEQDLWEELVGVLETVGSADGVRYMTNGELIDNLLLGVRDACLVRGDCEK